MLKLFSLLCFLAAGFLIWQRYRPIPSPSVALSGVEGAKEGPTSISIPSLNLNLPVIPGEIKNNRWPTTPRGVIFLTTSPASNTILYGHNWPNLLGRLKETQLGQSINVTYTNGQTKKFVISDIKTVGPNTTDILQPKSEGAAGRNDQLTIYTCIGFLDSKRLVVIAASS